jgi:hypothetical protein
VPTLQLGKKTDRKQCRVKVGREGGRENTIKVHMHFGKIYALHVGKTFRGVYTERKVVAYGNNRNNSKNSCNRSAALG